MIRRSSYGCKRTLSIDHPARKLAGNNFQVRVLPVKHMSLSGQWQIPFEAARSRADLLHFPHFDLPWATPGRVVATIHDLKYIAHPEFFPQLEEAKRLAMQIMMSFTCRRAQRIICVSKFTAQDLHERLGTPLHNLRVVPHGVEERFFTPALAGSSSGAAPTTSTSTCHLSCLSASVDRIRT